MRRWKCGRTKKTTISILPPSIQASCTSFQKKDRDWKKTDSRESPFSQTRITGFVDIILPFRRRENPRFFSVRETERSYLRRMTVLIFLLRTGKQAQQRNNPGS